MKLKLAFYSFLISPLLFSQVGVNTKSPKTTLDVSVNRDTSGKIINNAEIIGVQVPRLSIKELSELTSTYTAEQTSALIYITEITSGYNVDQRININSVGYYYFDGNIWQKLIISNIYNADGILTNSRYLDYNGNTLNFGNSSRGQYVSFSESNGLQVFKKADATPGRSSIGLSSGQSKLWIFNDENNASQLIAEGTTTRLAIGTRSTEKSANITFETSPGNNVVGSTRMVITGQGNIGIGTGASGSTGPSEKFDVNDGNIRFRSIPYNGQLNAIYTRSNGSISTSKDQTFNATRTLVADDNGVIGYVNGVFNTQNNAEIGYVNAKLNIQDKFVKLPTNVTTLNSNNTNTAKYTGISISLPPGNHKIDVNLPITLAAENTYKSGTNYVRIRLGNDTSDLSLDYIHPDAQNMKFVAQGFPYSQDKAVLKGSLTLTNSTTYNKTYYLHIDNAESTNGNNQIILNTTSNEAYVTYQSN